MKRVIQTVAITMMLMSTNVKTSMAMNVGNRFPAIVLPSVEDESAMSIEQFRGQKLMLHVFASW